MLQTTTNWNISENKIKKGMGIQLKCDFCEGPISGKTHVFKFANFERFFCCTECRSAYKKKYSRRIEVLTKRHSNFALLCFNHMKTNNAKNVLELGSGHGRDTIFFALNGLEVEALDYYFVAVEILDN
jgi:tellurite resistance protein TehB